MIDTVCRPLVLALLSQNVAVRVGHSLPLCGAGRGFRGPGRQITSPQVAGFRRIASEQRLASAP